MLEAIAQGAISSIDGLPVSSCAAAAAVLAQQVSKSTSVVSALTLHASILAIAEDAYQEVSVDDPDDVFSDVIEISTAAMHDAVAIPAASITDVKLKLELLIQEADGHVEVEDLAFLVEDLAALLGSTH